MVDVLRRKWYDEQRVLIETARILDPQFKSTILYVTGAQLEVLRNLMAYLNRESTFVSEYFNRYYLTPTASEWDSLLAVVANLEEKLMLIYVDDYVCVRDKRAVGVHAGASESGAWRQRALNDEQIDGSGICTLDSNQVTLEAGTYRCLIRVPARMADAHQARLYNVSDSEVTLVGTSEFAYTVSSVVTHSIVRGGFVLSVARTLEVQHRVNQSRVVDGLGRACNWGDEIYTIAEFWRMIG